MGGGGRRLPHEGDVVVGERRADDAIGLFEDFARRFKVGDPRRHHKKGSEGEDLAVEHAVPLVGDLLEDGDGMARRFFYVARKLDLKEAEFGDAGLESAVKQVLAFVEEFVAASSGRVGEGGEGEFSAADVEDLDVEVVDASDSGAVEASTV